MKNSKLLVLMLFALPGFNALADRGQPPDPAKFQAAIKACESSSLNTANVSLPAPSPGQRPQFSQAQMDLMKACESAGILPKHHGGPHGPPPQDEQNPKADESSN